MSAAVFSCKSMYTPCLGCPIQWAFGPLSVGHLSLLPVQNSSAGMAKEEDYYENNACYHPGVPGD